MSNWNGSARSNYFQVIDPDAFRSWVEKRGLELLENHEAAGLFGIHSGDSAEDGSWPSYDCDEDEEINLAAELAEHLTEGQIAVLIEVGSEKLCYLSASAVALDAAGTVVEVSLSDIYALAARIFHTPEEQISRAEC